jgi:hypothetical protein
MNTSSHRKNFSQGMNLIISSTLTAALLNAETARAFDFEVNSFETQSAQMEADREVAYPSHHLKAGTVLKIPKTDRVQIETEDAKLDINSTGKNSARAEVESKNKTVEYIEGVKIKSSPGLTQAQLKALNGGRPLLIPAIYLGDRIQATTSQSRSNSNLGNSPRKFDTQVAVQDISIYNSRLEANTDVLMGPLSKTLGSNGSCRFDPTLGAKQACAGDRNTTQRPSSESTAPSRAALSESSSSNQPKEVRRLEAHNSRMASRECNQLPSRGYDPRFNFENAKTMTDRLMFLGASAGVDSCAVAKTASWIEQNFNSPKFKNRRFVTIIDYSRPSHEKRMTVIDMKTGHFMKELTAQGRGTDHRDINSFSSRDGSGQTPLGVHVTSNPYFSSAMNRCAVRLSQMQMRGPSTSESRGVVWHGADYVDEGTARRTGYAGSTLGCPANSNKFFNSWAGHLAGGSIMYHFHKGLCRSSSR